MPRRSPGRRSGSSYPDWIKAVLITAVVMGTLWILLFKAPWFFGNNEAVAEGFFFVLLLPGILVFVPVMFTTNIHNIWPGYFVLGAILNWLLYSWLVYALMHFRRRKREAGLPPEPEESNYP